MLLRYGRGSPAGASPRTMCPSSFSRRARVCARSQRRGVEWSRGVVDDTTADWKRQARVVGTVVQLVARVRVARKSSVEVASWLAARLPELGPTYVKIGQFVSSREDIFGEQVSASFRSLQDSAPAVDFADVQRILAGQGTNYIGAFESVQAEPLASASIAQVHRATMKNGAQVVLKVKRPNLDRLIESDLAPLRTIINMLVRSGVSPEAVHARNMLSDFTRMLKEEVDFEAEVKNNKEFQTMYSLRTDVVVPKVLTSLCTKQVIVMEYVSARRLMDVASDPSVLSGFASRKTWVGEDAGELTAQFGETMAYRIMTLFVGQVLYRGGLIHGDPQPGNIGVTADGKLVLYDFGSALRLREADRIKLKLLMYYLITSDSPKALAAMQSLGVTVLNERLALNYMSTYAAYVRTMDFRAFQNHGSHEVPFALTETLLRLVRIFGILEGLCKKLHTEFDYTSLAVFTWDAFLLDPDFVAAKGVDDMASWR